MVSIFLFHRDLRISDNTTLIKLFEKTKKITPIFIFPPEQIDSKQNKYFSNPAVQFMCESLIDLDIEFKKANSKLQVFKGDTIDVLSSIHRKHKIAEIYQNRDYSKYTIERDASIARFCKDHSIDFVNEEDYDIISEKECLLPDGRPYTVLSQYYNKFQKEYVATDKIQKVNTKKVATFESPESLKIASNIEINKIKDFYIPLEHLKQHGGRKNGLIILKRIKSGIFKDYDKARDFPAMDKTTLLSAHLKFGTVSIREAYWALRDTYGKNNGIIRELVFRSFYLKIYKSRPELQRGTAWRKSLDEHIPWKMDKKMWDAWIGSKTGFPLVDAGMRQLHTEGWVHNRVRMLVASTPTRYLLLDWRDCARYFYQHLVDADTFSNTAGWQWSSGVAPDGAPYFRPPMNPFIQSSKFDPNAEYIKKWLPELNDVNPKDIHKWGDEKVRAKYTNKKIDYPAPIIDQKLASKRTTEQFKKAGKIKNT